MISPNDPTSAASKPITLINLSGQTPPPIDREFSPKLATSIIEACGLGRGRCLGSKSGYRQSQKKHFFIPNANLFTRPHGKIWWGDLDLWTDAEQLEQAARRLRTRLFVLSELDGRFDNQHARYRDILERAIWRTGGPARIDRRLIKNSGLKESDLQLLICRGVSGNLTASHIPYVAVQIERRIRFFRHLFDPIKRRLKLKHWGDWFNRPRANGRTPLAILKEDGELELIELEPELDFYRLLLFPRGPVDLEWPKKGGA